MKRISDLRRALSLLLALLICASVASPVLAEEKGDTIYIESAEDLIELAGNCRLDTWSLGKTVVLRGDISLDEVEFTPIPTFGGTFDGNGHTISGLEIGGLETPAGFISVLQEAGVVKSLSITGNVAPGGDARTVGGVVGENYGRVENCSFTGTVSGKSNVGSIAGVNAAGSVVSGCQGGGAVFGEKMTGGIVGCNLGMVTGCTNNTYVNINSVDPSISLDDINFDFIYDITKLGSSDASTSASDTGGIAGYSSGIIRTSVNNSVVGYQHVGYNVGGIAGRSCGYIHDCVNHAEVYGRKDVGGIVGQVEPYLEMDLSEDTRSKLKGQLDELSSMIDSTLTHVSDGSGTIARRLNNMSRYLDDAGKALNDLGATGNIDSTVIGGGQASGSGGVSVTPPDAEVESSAEANGSAGITVIPPVSGEAGGSVETEVTVDWTPGGVNGGGEVSGLGGLDASTQITVTASAGKLSSAVSGMSGQMHLLNNEAAGLSSGLASDLKAINRQIQAIYNTLFDVAEELQSGQSGEHFADTSEVDVDQVTLGKTASCTNDGVISGDINVGGVAGSMAIEYELDPEDDISGSITGVQRRSYEMKAIIQNCTSNALVSAKRSHAGGVCGLMDLGLITGCRGYGNVESENGDYVGGVAGLAAGTVRGCFAKAFLSGEKYVGGIVGSGVAEDAGGSSSLVAGCYAFVSIPDYEQYVGGVSGGETGEFVENYFVSDTLAGINGRSYTGKAEPISYEQLIATEGMPKEFRKLTVRFEADGKTLDTVTMDYGETFDPVDYPAIPQKEGYYAKWDVPDLGEVRFDEVVSVVYTQYATTLASESRREDNRPVLLVEGLFDQDDMLTATPEAKTAEQLSLLSEDAGEAVGQYFSFLEKKELPASSLCREIVEQWSIQIPDDGRSSHTVRYLPVNGETRNLLVFVKDGDRWKEVETGTVGSYLTFVVRGSAVELAIVSAIPMWWVWLAFGLLILVLLLVILRLANLAKRRKRDRRAAAAAAAIPAAVTANTGNGERDELLQRAMDAEMELARTRAELDALKSEKQAGTQAGVKDENLFRQYAGETNIRPEKRRRRKWPLVVLLCLLAAAAILAAVLLYGGKARDSLASYRLLQSYAQRDELSMELTAHAVLGDTVFDNTVGIERVSEDGYTVSCIKQYGIPLYYADDTVYLENGKAYRVGKSYPDSSDLLDQTLELYRDLTISAEDDGYCIIAQGSDAEKLVRTIAPSLAELAAEIDEVEVELIEEKGSLSAIRFTSDGTLSAGDPYTLEAELTILDTKSDAEVPHKVMAALKDEGESAAMVLTEDVVRLLSAWMDVMQEDTMCADLTLEADCGPLVVNDKVQLLRMTESGQAINCIRKSDLALYFTEDTICDQNGNSVSAKDERFVRTSDLLEIAYQACLNGEVSCTERDDGYRYTLELDEKGMENMAYAISPETENMNISYEKSGLEVVIGENGAISSFHLICSGGVTVVLSETPASFSAAVDFRDIPEDFEIPAAVSKSLAN